MKANCILLISCYLRKISNTMRNSWTFTRIASKKQSKWNKMCLMRWDSKRLKWESYKIQKKAARKRWRPRRKNYFQCRAISLINKRRLIVPRTWLVKRGICCISSKERLIKLNKEYKKISRLLNSQDRNCKISMIKWLIMRT